MSVDERGALVKMGCAYSGAQGRAGDALPALVAAHRALLTAMTLSHSLYRHNRCALYRHNRCAVAASTVATSKAEPTARYLVVCLLRALSTPVIPPALLTGVPVEECSRR